MLTKIKVKTTFADVAGLRRKPRKKSAKLVEFRVIPGKFQRRDGYIRAALLMVGQPGTGKTLLAKGGRRPKPKVPFFTISAFPTSSMMSVGVGASRVRDMFEQARSTRPALS